MKKSFCSIGDGRERWSFTGEKASFAASDWTNGVFYWWKVIVRQTTSSLARKLASRLFIFKMSERFVDVGSVDNFIAEQENKATLQKTQRDVKLLQTFLGTRNELRKVEEIPALELNEYICEFIISVRTKDGKDYEPSSLRSLLASFERHLKKNSYSASIMNDLVFAKTRKVLLSKQKELQKKGNWGNRPNASIAVTVEDRYDE